MVTNPTVAGCTLTYCCRDFQREGFKPQVVMIPDGEEYKQLAQLEQVYDAAVRPV